MSVSIRKLAAMAGVSTTSICTARRFQSIADDRGCGDEYRQRTRDGEKPGRVLRELMPDVLADEQFRAARNSFRSAARKLINAGVSIEDMIEAIKEIAQEAQQ